MFVERQMKRSLKNGFPWGVYALLALFLTLLISGCGGGGVRTVSPETPTAPVGRANPDILTEGDRIVITYSGIPVPPVPHAEQIRQDGTVQPPFLTEPVQAAGLTTGEFRQRLMALYVPSIFTRISLTVKAEERYITIDGEVNAPGLYPYIGTMTVLDGIASARGLNNFANKKRIRVTRADGTSMIFNYNKAQEDPKHDLPLYPGDLINAPRRLY